MPRTNKQHSRGSLWNAMTKLKHLTMISKSQGLVIPKNFLETLEITKQTLLVMTLSTIDNRIIIEKVKNPEDYKFKFNTNEKVDYIISE